MPKIYQVVGQKYAGWIDPYLRGFLAGADAYLIREPDNAVDANAVQVWVADPTGRPVRVGYIPMKDNQVLAQFIDQRGEAMALDAAQPSERALKVRFCRSKNRGYPQVEVE